MYSLPYILYLVFIFLLSFKCSNVKQRRDVNILIIITYVLFLGLRGYIGSDFKMYYVLYENIPSIGQGFFSSAYVNDLEVELGYVIYMSIIKTISSDYSFFIFINSLINIYIILLFFKRYSINVALALIVFLEIGGYVFEIDVQRNMKALLLFMLSLKYLEERKLFPYMFLNGLGFLFHSSALIYVPLYWILHKPINLSCFWKLYLLGNVVFFLKIPLLSFVMTPILDILGGRYAILATNYLDTGVLSDYGMSIGFFVRIAGAILISVYYNRLIEFDKRMIIFINCIFVYLLIYAYFSEIRMLTLRLSNLFFFSYAIVIPMIYKLIKIKRQKICYLIVIFFVAILKVNGKVNSPIYEYDCVLMKHMSPIERSSRIESFYINLE